jgi:hypothetical protein
LGIRPALPQRARRDATALADAFTTWLRADVGSGRFEPRIMVDPGYADFYEGCIVDPHADSDRQTFFNASTYAVPTLRQRHPVAHRLKTAMDELHTLVNASSIPATDPSITLGWLLALRDVLNDHFLVVTLEVEPEAFSYTVFATLNARGTGLTDARGCPVQRFWVVWRRERNDRVLPAGRRRSDSPAPVLAMRHIKLLVLPARHCRSAA